MISDLELLASASLETRRFYFRQLAEQERRESVAKRSTSFLEFCRNERLFRGDAPVLHQEMMISYLQQLESGKIERLMIFAPPGSAKSSYTSIRFAAWYLGKHPEDSVIQASNTQPLASRWGRKVRNIVGSRAFQEVFPGTGPSSDSGRNLRPRRGRSMAEPPSQAGSLWWTGSC